MPKAPSPLNLPCPLDATTVPVTGAPARRTVTPCTRTDCASVPVKVSPTLLFLALTVCSHPDHEGVPAGTVYTLGGGGGGGGGGSGRSRRRSCGRRRRAGAAGGLAAGAGAGAAWAVVVDSAAGAGAGALLHPPRSSKPASMLARAPAVLPGCKPAVRYTLRSISSAFSSSIPRYEFGLRCLACPGVCRCSRKSGLTWDPVY